LYQIVVNRVTGQDVRNKLLEVEKEKLLAEQECISLQNLVEQERNKVSNNHLMLD
jgi:hypothetical protein